MKYILIIASLLIFSGCIVEKKPPITDFKLKTDLQQFNTNSKACKDKTLKISKAFSSSSLMSLRMVYVQNQNKVFSYSKSQWLTPPAQAIAKEIFFSLKSAKLFKHVSLDISRSNSDYVMEIIIEDFMQYYDENLNTSYANVKIDINIIDLMDSSIIASEEFSSKVNTKTLDAQGGVEALSTALSEVIQKNIEWLNGVCK